MGSVSKTFVGTAGTELTAFDSDWTEHTSYSAGSMILTNANRVRASSSTTTCYYHSWTPSSPNYRVAIDWYCKTAVSGWIAYVCGRVNTANNTMYIALAWPGNGYRLYRIVSGTTTQIGSTSAKTFSADTNYNLVLEMEDSGADTIVRLYAEGDTTPKITYTDTTPITAAGKAAIRTVCGATISDTTGWHATTFNAEDLGGGGTTHEAALTLAASGGLSGGANVAFAASIAFAATGGISDGAAADYAAAWSATATAALTPGGAATMLAALTLTGTTSLAGSAVATFAAAATFPAVAGVAASYGSIVTAALALESVGGMTAAVQAQYQAAITAATTAGITPAAAAILSASFQAAVVAALAASTGGMDHEAALALPCSAALSATTYAELAAALTLATGTAVDAAALATMFAGVAFPVLAALAATHPDDIASAVRVVVMFQTASAQIGFTTKSANVTIQ